MRFHLVSLVAFALAWTAAWALVLRPLLRRYAATTALPARIEAAGGDALARLRLRLEGRKSLLLLFATSLYGTLKGAADQAAAAASQLASAAGALTPDAVAPLADRSMWQALVGDAAALHVLAALQLLCAVLVLRGHLAAAKLEPRA